MLLVLVLIAWKSCNYSHVDYLVEDDSPQGSLSFECTQLILVPWKPLADSLLVYSFSSVWGLPFLTRG